MRWAVLLVAATVGVAGCGSSDSTVSKTPEPTVASPAQETPRPAPSTLPPPPPVVAPSATAAADPCAVDNAAPEIAKAVSE
ncbi:MAG TPA: LppP/LprE family lipoprotein, partial [Mycobacterium sp.]|nr:LppP/LprE family lipoprotein [Mycobacterium sp.]